MESILNQFLDSPSQLLGHEYQLVQSAYCQPLPASPFTA